MSLKTTSVVLMFVLLGSGCAHYPENARMKHYAPEGGYRFSTLSNTDNSDSLQVVLAFSGGGTRAAALSYGVLDKLARTEIVWEGQRRRLLDEVDTISSVSGGSFTAAYYALYGDQIFTDFDQKFLSRNIQRQMFWRFCSPRNWVRLKARELRSYQNARERPYVHLLDGGLTDNLGLRGPFEEAVAWGGARNALQRLKLQQLLKIVIIVVNAASNRNRDWDRSKSPPNIVQVTMTLATVPMNRYSFETLEVYKDSVKQWEAELNDASPAGEAVAALSNRTSPRVKLYMIDVSLDALRDEAVANMGFDVAAVPEPATEGLFGVGGTFRGVAAETKGVKLFSFKRKPPLARGGFFCLSMPSLAVQTRR
jgi:hypothetical protein